MVNKTPESEEEHGALSARLARAIGWVQVLTLNHCVAVREEPFLAFRKFDYRDPSVIWPIAERFNCFPNMVHPTRWVANPPGGTYQFADTAALAALSAILSLKEPK